MSRGKFCFTCDKLSPRPLIRHCCRPCYAKWRRAVINGGTTWRKLEKSGKVMTPQLGRELPCRPYVPFLAEMF